MTSLRTIGLGALAGAALLAASASVHANGIYNWSFNDSAGSNLGESGSGTLTLVGNEITAFTGTLSGAYNDTITGIIPSPSFPSIFGTPGFNVDNVFNPTAPFTDFWGIAFSTVGNASWNLWDQGGGDVYLWACCYSPQFNSGNPSGFNVTAFAGPGGGPVGPGGAPVITPLPSTWTMLIAGFLGLGFLAYSGTKKRTEFAAA